MLLPRLILESELSQCLFADEVRNPVENCGSPQRHNQLKWVLDYRGPRSFPLPHNPRVTAVTSRPRWSLTPYRPDLNGRLTPEFHPQSDFFNAVAICRHSNRASPGSY